MYFGCVQIGGALYLSGSDTGGSAIQIRLSKFRNNLATFPLAYVSNWGSGGAIFAADLGLITISSSTFLDNRAVCPDMRAPSTDPLMMSVCLQARKGGTIMAENSRGPVTFTKCTFLNSRFSQTEEKLRRFADKPWLREYSYSDTEAQKCTVNDIRKLQDSPCFIGLIVYAKFKNPVDTFPNLLSCTDCVLDSSKVCELVACTMTVYVCLMRVLAPRCRVQTVVLPWST